MDITYYFSKNKNSFSKNKFSDKKICNKDNILEQKKVLSKQYINIIKKLVANNLLDILDYTVLINFLKSKGPIVQAHKFHEILNNIMSNSQISDEDKNKLKQSTNMIFSHLYDILEEKISDVKDVKVEKLIKEIELYNENKFTFTNDQINAIKNICYFLYDPTMKTFGLYGYAGTGKTTTITKLIHFLLFKNYINSVVFTAPTNKAVNVIKSKFRSDLDDLIKNKFNSELDNNDTLDDILDQLEEKGFKINFLTIHKLLNYQNDFDIEGERIFIKGDKASLNNYDLVVVDECSMLPMQIITHLFEEAYKKDIMNKTQKHILFIADPCQLPPVKENISIIFAKNKKDISFESYKNLYIQNNNKESLFDKNIISTIEKKYNELYKNILELKTITLKEVMRSNDDKVVGLCNEIRKWVLNEIKFPKSYLYKDKKVFLYKNEKNKMDSEWFKKCIEYFKSKDNNQHVSNIILTWTNKQTDEYNELIRKILYKKQKLNKFEVGDILILTDFYNIKETELKNPKIKESHKFYTSEQIKITDIEHVIKAIPEFIENIPKRIKKIKNFIDIEEKYIRTIKIINKNTTRKYNTWKLFIHKLSDVIVDSIPETYQIFVVDDDSVDKLTKERKFVADEIKKLRNYYRNMHKENIMSIDRDIIKPLWKELNKKLVDTFARVNNSCSISVHRGQGSTFYNVFVDADDILKNPNIEEAKRCLYTACTRTSNELHILI